VKSTNTKKYKNTKSKTPKQYGGVCFYVRLIFFCLTHTDTMAMSRSKRINVEIDKLRNQKSIFLLIYSDNGYEMNCDSAITGFRGEPPAKNVIIGRLLPKSDPFSRSGFNVLLTLPEEFPMKPPEVKILTPIYHPNIHKDGKMCFGLINQTDSWKPATTLVEVINAIIDIIDKPKLQPVSATDTAFEYQNGDMSREYQDNRSEFMKKATKMIDENPVPRELHH